VDFRRDGTAWTLQHNFEPLLYKALQYDVARSALQTHGMSKGFFANSGAEANEGAIRGPQVSFLKYGEGRSKIVSPQQFLPRAYRHNPCRNGQQVFHNYFFPFTDVFVFAEPETPRKRLRRWTNRFAPS
jgi:acetylornithine/N-succinyldiaminopimelate aminotransferase